MEVISRQGVATVYGRWLKQAIERKGWNQTRLQTEIAIATGATVTQPSISSYITGQRLPDPHTMLQIGKTLGEDPSWNWLRESAEATGLYLREELVLPALAASGHSRRMKVSA